MKDKYKNIWRRSEMRDLIKNILIYGDRWDIITEKTGTREEQKYKKHAKRFFVKNSFILNRIYENSNSSTIDNFFEIKNEFLILNFSAIKMKFKEIKAEKLSVIKKNFYKNLKSLAIENFYFDEDYVNKNFSNENLANEENCEINENQSFAFTTNNNYTENLQSNYIEDQFNSKDSYSESDKRENLTNFLQSNHKNLIENRNYYSANNSCQNNNFFTGCKNENYNYNNINFNDKVNSFGNTDANLIANFGFHGFTGFNENLHHSKDPNLLNNFNNYYNSNNYFLNENYENENNIINQTKPENIILDDNDKIPFYDQNNANSFNNFTSNSFYFKNFNSMQNNNYGEVSSKIYENSVNNDGDKSEINNLKDKNSNTNTSKLKQRRDYNKISLRILKRFNALNKKNESNTTINNENFEEEFFIDYPFYIDKIHKENQCRHKFNNKKTNNKRKKIKQAAKKENESQEVILHAEKNNIDNNEINQNKINNNFKNNLVMELNEDQDYFKVNEENTNDLISNISQLNKEENLNESNKEKNQSKENKIENWEPNIINKISNLTIKKDESISLAAIDNISRKNSDIFRLDKDYAKKKMSANSLITQISQNYLNAETNEDFSPTKNLNVNENNLNPDKHSAINLESLDNKMNKNVAYIFKQLTNINQTDQHFVDSEEKNIIEYSTLNEAFLHRCPIVQTSFKSVEENKEETTNTLLNNNNINITNNLQSGLFVQKKRLRNPKNYSKKSDLKASIKFTEKILSNCESKIYATSESFNEVSNNEIKSRANNIFTNQNQLERELNNEFNNFNKDKYEEKIEVEETLSSNHSEVGNQTNKNVISKNYENENFNNSFLIKNINFKQEVKNDMLNYDKNYQLYNENSNNFNNANLFINNNNNQNINISNNESNIQNNFFDKLSVLSDKGRSTVNIPNTASVNFSNFFNANINNKDNFGFNTNLNNNSNNNNNNTNNAFANYPNNSNKELNANLQNVNNNNNYNCSLNFSNNGNKFLQSTNLTDMYFNSNSKIAAGLNSDNISNVNKKNISRKNSSSNNRNHNLIIPNNNIINNDNDNNNESIIKKPGRKNDSFRITKGISDESHKSKLKDSMSNSLNLNNKISSENFINFEENPENASPLNKANDVFIIEKLTKEEKENLKILELTKLQEKEANEDNNFESENIDESYVSYNTDFLEKSNFNNSTIKALVSLRKLTFKKNSIDLTGNNILTNINNQIRNSAEKNEIINSDEKYPNKENNNDKYQVLRKLSLKNLHDNRKLTINDLNDPNENKDYQDENSNLKSNNLNDIRKESSLAGDNLRKDSFIITKEIKRKDTNLTVNAEMKMSIDEVGLKSDKTLLQPLRVNKRKQILYKNKPEMIDDSEYNNLKPSKPFNNNESSNNSFIQEKPVVNKYNFVTFKENKFNNTSHGLIASELDIDTIKSLRPNFENKSNLRKVNKSNNSNNISQSVINTNSNYDSNKDSQIFTNFNSYVYNIDLMNKNTNNSLNPCSNNNLNFYKPEICSNIIDMNNGNEIAQNFSKEKNSQFSYDNNFNKECLMFSEFNDDLEYCMNSSDSDKSSEKKKILDDKVEKLICSVIQKQKKHNNNKAKNKIIPNIDQIINSNNYLTKSNNNISNNNFANLNATANNNINNNTVNNAFMQNNNNNNNNNNNKEIKFSVNNFSQKHSNKVNKENSDTNSFSILNNFENIKTQPNNLSNNATINPTNYYNGPASITTNNINNFHIINSNGPCIFPITHNITNYGNMTSHTISPQAPIIKGDYKIQNQNFNIITDENSNSEQNSSSLKNEKIFDNIKKFVKYSDAEIIDSTVFKTNKNFNINQNDNNNNNNNNKVNKINRSDKPIFNSVSGVKDKGICNISNKNININNLNNKDKNNINIFKSSNNNNNTNKNQANKNNPATNNNTNSNKETCLTKIENFSDFNLGNFNDGPIPIKHNNNNNNSNNQNNNNILASYEHLKVFEDKSNFMHDKRNQINYNKPNNIYNNSNNYLINNGTLISNSMQFNGFNSLTDNQPIIINNPNQCKEDFNFSDPFDLNFHIDNKIEDQSILNNKVENINDDVFDMLGFN